TEVAGLSITKCGDDRYYNNIFVGGVKEIKGCKSGLGVYENAELPMFVDGNVYMNGARKFINENNKMELDYNPNIQIKEKEDGTYLSMNLEKAIFKMKNRTITTEFLGKVKTPNLSYENPDGTSIVIDKDFLAKTRNSKNPSVGPFENPGAGEVELKVWEK
ncbi:MAG: hypothetical protein KAH68_09410, partial [Draconibacterium sp.]|nr:hypothetical protein [Draconibacterium sp.]